MGIDDLLQNERLRQERVKAEFKSIVALRFIPVVSLKD